MYHYYILLLGMYLIWLDIKFYLHEYFLSFSTAEIEVTTTQMMVSDQALFNTQFWKSTY